MMSKCEWCDYKENEWLLHKSLHWSVYLADVQDYVGRCILVLNRHCGSLSELDISEWIELKSRAAKAMRTIVFLILIIEVLRFMAVKSYFMPILRYNNNP